MSYRSVLGGLAFAALVAGVAGCGDNKTSVSATTKADNGQRLRVVGRVINAQTGLPVSASIEICGVASSGVDNNGNFAIEIAGNLTDNGLDVDSDSEFAIKVSANGNATLITFADLENDESDEGGSGETDPGLNSISVVNLGTISLNTAFTQTLLITKDGQPLTGVQVIVGQDIGTGQAFTGGVNEESNCNDTQVGTTNSVGVVTFSGLDPFRLYRVVVPAQNTGGDASPDFRTINASFTVQSTGGTFALDTDSTNFFTSFPSIEGDNSFSLDLQTLNDSGPSGAFKTGVVADTVTASVFDPLRTTIAHPDGTQVNGIFDFGDSDVGADTSDDRMGNSSFSSLQLKPDTTRFSNEGLVKSSDGSVTLVFSSPVHVVQGGSGREVHFRYADNMSDPRSATFNHFILVTGTATQVDNGLGSLWTFKPNATIPLYTSYSLQFTAHSAVDASRVRNFDFSDDGYFRVPTGLSSTISTSADNLNGKTGATSGTATANTAVNLEFDRLVEGSYRVVEYTTDNRRVSFDGNTRVFNLGDGNSTLALVNNVNGGTATATGSSKLTGATAGFRFRVELLDPDFDFVVCGDNITGHKNQVRVALVVQDIEGNRIDEIQDLDVK